MIREHDGGHCGGLVWKDVWTAMRRGYGGTCPGALTGIASRHRRAAIIVEDDVAYRSLARLLRKSQQARRSLDRVIIIGEEIACPLNFRQYVNDSFRVL